MKLFFAINLPDKIRTELDKINKDLKNKLPKAKWVAKQNIHLTVKFLGEVNDNILENMINEAKKAVKGPEGFNINLEKYDLFPPTHPRIVYVTLESPGLIDFVKNFIVQIDQLDFIKSERREFLPHITMARIKDRFEPKHFVTVEETKYQNSFTVENLDLMSSELTPAGPIYNVVKSLPL